MTWIDALKLLAVFALVGSAAWAAFTWHHRKRKNGRHDNERK